MRRRIGETNLRVEAARGSAALPTVDAKARMMDHVPGGERMHARWTALSFPSRRAKTVRATLSATPEKYYYVPLPQISRLRVPSSFLASIGRPLRSRHRAGRVVRKWRASHTLEARVGTLVIALAVVLGIVITRI